MKKKKIIAIIFSMMIITALFAGVGMTAFAAERNITVDNIEYELNSDNTGKFYCVKSSRYASGDVVIPDEINGIPVTEILSAAFVKNHNITSVSMGNNIVRIYNDAFSHCYSLTSVTFGSNVQMLGLCAFDSCNELNSITINDKLAVIQKQAFKNCLCLATLTMGMGLETIGENAFEGCKALTTVTLPDSVSLEGTGAGEEVRVSLNEKLKAELPEMMAQRDEMQAELDALNSRIEAVREFIGADSTNTGSVFGIGNTIIILVCAVIAAAIIPGVFVIVRKKQAAGQKVETTE